MAKETIIITGVGRVFVKTAQPYVELAGAVAADGTPVNRRTKRVSSAAKYHAEAERNSERYYLHAVRHDVFVLRDLQDTAA